MLAVGWCLWYPDIRHRCLECVCSTFLSFLSFLTRVLSLKTLNGFGERVWIEIGILNIHFGQFSTFLFSHFSSLISFPLRCLILDVGWCLWYPDTSSLFGMLCSTFLSFLSFLIRVLSLKTLNGFGMRVWIEIGILNIHFGQFSTFSFLSLLTLSFPFHSDVGCWMVYFGSEVFVVSRYVMAVCDVVFNVFKLSALPQSCPELKNVEWVCEREWIEIGILNIHFGQFSTSLFSFLVSHFSFPFHSHTTPLSLTSTLTSTLHLPLDPHHHIHILLVLVGV